jgi:hypothetical protein
MSTKNQGLLTLTASQVLEQDLVDFFLDSQHQHGFTTLHARGHSSDHGDLSPMEQVTGRRHQVQFQILVDESEVDDICKRLEAAFPGAKIHYWFLTATRQGRI